ncbi:MAG: hypothetical protein ABI675_02855 [Chitinophagaceae bacterium]
MNPRTLELIIVKTFDELTIEESKELSDIINQDDSNKGFIESLMQDKEKLMDFISHYAKENVERDDKKLEKAWNKLDQEIAKMRRY